MARKDGFISELNHEAAITRKMLERIPADKFDWKPHEKSTAMGKLATHIADMFSWFQVTLTTDELDFAKDYNQSKPQTTEELTALLDKNVTAAQESLQNVEDDEFMKPWKLRNGEHIILEMAKIGVLRGLVMNHIVHHRGQLSVYLRMNDIPVPSIYGPSADEQ